MRITILTYGSRGNVQPFLPLSLGLMANGHSVKLAAPARFKELVEEHGIDFVPLAGDLEGLGRRLNNAGYNFIKILHELMDYAIENGADVLRQTEAAIVVPFTADQPFWGIRVHAISMGPKPILVKNLSAERLTHALAKAESDSLREGAQLIGQKIRTEDGVGEAVRLIEKYSNDFQNKHL
jgi:UDP:flavonoid glycosyltransferase YjiC (YdhE family)